MNKSLRVDLTGPHEVVPVLKVGQGREEQFKVARHNVPLASLKYKEKKHRKKSFRETRSVSALLFSMWIEAVYGEYGRRIKSEEKISLFCSLLEAILRWSVTGVGC